MFEDGQQALERPAPRRVAKKTPSRRHRGPANDVGVTELVYSRAGKILLLELHHDLQRMLHRAFRNSYSVLLMWDAFPDRLPGSKTKFFMDAIDLAVEQADPPLPEELTEHAKTCTDWVREVSTLVSAFICCAAVIP